MRHRFLKENTIENAFKAICFLSILLPLVLIVVLIGDAVIDGWSRLSLDFLTGFPSRKPELAGFLPALVGSFYLMLLTSAIAIPLGLGAAIYLEEYAKPGFLTSLIEINISNMAGVPSIIYGLLVLELFVRMSHMGRSLLAGAWPPSVFFFSMGVFVFWWG